MTLTVRGIVAGYGRGPVLHGVDLDAGPAELVSVLGASGSGKTTLLRVVAGLHRPDGGTVRFGDDDVTAVAPERRRVGLVPQEGALFAHLSVARNIGFGLTPGRRAPLGRSAAAAAARERVGELLELVGLADKAGRMPHQLSGGERRRVALARALAPRPRVVLLDEPFSALDAGLREQVRGEVVTALRAAGSTAVLITHDRREALSVSDRIAVLHGGRVEQTATPRELYAAPATARVARFVGDTALLPGTVCGAHVETVVGRAPMRAPAPGPGDAVLVVLRPEQLRLTGPGAGGAPGEVVHVEFLGEALLVGARPDGGPTVRVRAAPGEHWRPGDRCCVRIEGPVHVVPDA
ncbi:ABC transporter ATP-binding protein [Pseudonocardia parietis]|uniref:Iron(III) transport system ATP-binding protein n=1 Tax=Pseudonocardia parietis TaxID=570936 RepID=A0ABS4VVI7_9PSEU|nr:ABC transporter ATP-binding protein [Pseudonocardia parietis]MBP2367947.1 iron(III) transport system ATP-binding protein [Pseudonocardia parietis]